MFNLLGIVNGLGSIYEIDSSIAQHQHLLATSSRSDLRRILYLSRLAILQVRRYKLSNQSKDFDKFILYLAESILLQPRSQELCRMIQGTIPSSLFTLALALVKRSKASNQPEDAIYAAKYLRYLRDQPHGMSGFPRQAFTAPLVDALANQVELEARNVMECIEEMAVLCHELLTLEASDDDTTRSITRFAGAVLSKILVWESDQPLNKVIECLRLARVHRPDVRVALHFLACSLFFRYCATYANDVYEEAVSVYDEIIASSPAGDDRAADMSRDAMTALALIRSWVHETPEYSEEAMYRAHTTHSSSLFDGSRFDHCVKIAAGQRFDYFGSIEGPETSSGNSSLPRLAGRHADLRGVHPAFETVELLDELLSGIHNTNMTEIGKAIERGRTVLASAPRNLFKPHLRGLFRFGQILFEAFKRTNKIEYLNESISTFRQVYEHPSMHFLRYTVFSYLSEALMTRAVTTRTMSIPGRPTQDMYEVLKLNSQRVNDAYMSLPTRFQFSCLWAYGARSARDPSVSEAYESAVSLMQDALLFAPTLQQQHATLNAFPITHTVSLDYTSYQIDLHRLEEAVETLERGRALLWSEMRHLRTPIDQLQQEHPQLGHEFVAISKNLEELTKSIPPSHKLSIDDDAADNPRADDLRAVDPFGRLLLKQRELLKERNNLTSRIRALPGFDSFLTSPSFDTLRSAATSGPVIIINHSKFRSDILILLHNTSPSLIPTSDDFYDRASALKNKLLDSRLKYGLDSSHYDDTLASVLAELYDLVGKPVIDRLDQLQVPRQSRIWWCPTSVFCSLPLHALGPIPSDDGEKRYFLDLYICSYTPTLSALIQSRNRDSGPQSSDRPSLLLVAQPDPSLPTVGGEIQVVQALNTEVTTLISEAATPAAVIDGFHHHRFVHFACHGTLETGKPFEAGFELYGERLTLLEIVRSHLPTAEFAFLSACHTAEVTEGSVVDEGLHLAAAVQYCGFRSVVGTTWAMVDEDGQDLAEHFYKALFSNSRREQGIPYHERSAKALRFAVKKLRRKRWITLERWVNFVHYGA
ncbi:CHAT domain-containing protein [Lactarius hengduanensis]|nr:CHAT domain-containing protein [Lactarius hengduanensis]